VPFVVIEGLLLWFLWKAKPVAIWLFITQLVLATLNTTLYYFIAVNNLDMARATYIAHSPLC
jgi:hypothetical protein